jgi:DNA-binding MarR family transcriptional regulator
VIDTTLKPGKPPHRILAAIESLGQADRKRLATHVGVSLQVTASATASLHSRGFIQPESKKANRFGTFYVYSITAKGKAALDELGRPSNALSIREQQRLAHEELQRRGGIPEHLIQERF